MIKKIINSAVLSICKEYSDEEHPIRLKEIVDHLNDDFNTDADRRTIYATFDILRASGYSVIQCPDRRGYYYFDSRLYSKKDAIRITHALNQDESLTSREKERLQDKILKELSIYQRKEVRDML